MTESGNNANDDTVDGYDMLRLLLKGYFYAAFKFSKGKIWIHYIYFILLIFQLTKVVHVTSLVRFFLTLI